MRRSHAIAYGECGHSAGGCTCEIFVFDPDLTRQKDEDAYDAMMSLKEDEARDRRLGIIYGKRDDDGQ